MDRVRDETPLASDDVPRLVIDPAKVSRSAQAPVTLLFLGAQGIGKSGFINRLIHGLSDVDEENETDPYSPLPSALRAFSVTRDFIALSYEATNVFSIVSQMPEFPFVATGFTTLSSLATRLEQLFATSDGRNPRFFRVSGPFPNLPSHVTLIDAPGWCDAIPMVAFYRHIKRADAIIVLSITDEHPRDSSMCDAVWLAMGAEARLAGAKRPLILNAVYKPSIKKSEPVPADEHELAWGFPETFLRFARIYRPYISLSALVRAVDAHRAHEEERVRGFVPMLKARLDAGLQLPERHGILLDLVRARQDHANLGMVQRHFGDSLYTLNGAMQPMERKLLLGVNVADWEMGATDPSFLFLHLLFAVQSQVCRHLQEALDMYADAPGGSQHPKLFNKARLAEWAVNAPWPNEVSALNAYPEFARQWAMITVPVNPYERYLLAWQTLKPFIQQLHQAGVDYLDALEGELVRHYASPV